MRHEQASPGLLSGYDVLEMNIRRAIWRHEKQASRSRHSNFSRVHPHAADNIVNFLTINNLC